MSEGLMKMAEGYEMIAAGIRQMISAGRHLPDAAGEVTEKKEAAEAESPKGKEKDEPQIDRKTVRAFLTEKSRAGKTSEVKSLITEFGYSKLSDMLSKPSLSRCGMLSKQRSLQWLMRLRP